MNRWISKKMIKVKQWLSCCDRGSEGVRGGGWGGERVGREGVRGALDLTSRVIFSLQQLSHTNMMLHMRRDASPPLSACPLYHLWRDVLQTFSRRSPDVLQMFSRRPSAGNKAGLRSGLWWIQINSLCMKLFLLVKFWARTSRSDPGERLWARTSPVDMWTHNRASLTPVLWQRLFEKHTFKGQTVKSYAIFPHDVHVVNRL